MPRLHRILFPIDYSERSVAAGPRVKTLAERFHAEVILLHVLPSLPAHLAALDLTSLLPGSRAALEERAQQELGHFLDTELADLEGLRILAEGSPADSILRHAEALAADLIVMPTRGLDLFHRYVTGSVTAKVLRDASIPVCTGDAAAPYSRHIERIICAVDVGPGSAKTITWASNLADQFHARVTLVHVAQIPRQSLRHDFDRCRRQSLVRWAREQLQKVQGAVKTNWDMHIEAGEPAKDVVRAACAMKADLLVIGRSRHEGLMAGLQADTYAIAGRSPCPVVSV